MFWSINSLEKHEIIGKDSKTRMPREMTSSRENVVSSPIIMLEQSSEIRTFPIFMEKNV